MLGIVLLAAAIVGGVRIGSEPGWQFIATEMDLGTVACGKEIVVTFPARNFGWREERIAGNLRANCGIEGCAYPRDDLGLVLAPGESGEFVVVYIPRFPGDHTKEFEVFTAGRQLSRHTLKIHCRVTDDCKPEVTQHVDEISAQSKLL